MSETNKPENNEELTEEELKEKDAQEAAIAEEVDEMFGMEGTGDYGLKEDKESAELEAKAKAIEEEGKSVTEVTDDGGENKESTEGREEEAPAEEEVTETTAEEEETEEKEDGDTEEGDAKEEEKEEEPELTGVEAELALLREQNEKLLKELNNTGTLSHPTVMPQPEPTAPVLVAPGAVPAPVPVVPVPAPAPEPAVMRSEPLTDTRYEEIMATKEAFDKYINDQMEISRQGSLMEIGNVVRKVMDIRERVDQFFAGDPRLSPIKELVKKRAGEYEAVNPGFSVEQLLTQSAKDLEHLVVNIQQQQAENETVKSGPKGEQVAVRRTKGVSPAQRFAKPTTTRAPQATVKKGGGNTIEDEVDELLKVGQ